MQTSTCHPKQKVFLGLQPSDWTQNPASCRTRIGDWPAPIASTALSARLLIHEEEEEKAAEGQYIFTITELQLRPSIHPENAVRALPSTAESVCSLEFSTRAPSLVHTELRMASACTALAGLSAAPLSLASSKTRCSTKFASSRPAVLRRHERRQCVRASAESRVSISVVLL